MVVDWYVVFGCRCLNNRPQAFNTSPFFNFPQWQTNTVGITGRENGKADRLSRQACDGEITVYIGEIIYPNVIFL